MAVVTTVPVRIERFDALMVAVVAGLLAAIGLVVAAGDRAGVGAALIDSAGDALSAPQPLIRSAGPIRVRFSDPMDPASVTLHFDPPVDGSLAWNGPQLTFTPKLPFEAGRAYTVQLAAGARSLSGRLLNSALEWSVRVERPSIVYMAPSRSRDGAAANLWQVIPPQPPAAITHSQYGVVDFAPSPDGRQVAFSQKDAAGRTDLYLLTLADGSIRRLTNCVNAPCRAPSWSPDGNRIVYERANSSRPESDVRAWLLDVRTLATEPLFSESQWLGEGPHWSPDGKTIALYDRNLGALVLANMVSGDRSLIQTLEAASGEFAPDGGRIIYGQIVPTASGVLRRLEIADFGGAEHAIHPLTASDDGQVDDAQAVWSPDGRQLAVMRRYFDSRTTDKYQVYEVNTETGDAQPLVVDPLYAHGAVSWSPDGLQLLMQRYPYTEPDAAAGIWVFDTRTKALTGLPTTVFYHNGYLE